MAAGLPVIATAVGGLPDVVADGETGLLIPVDEAALAAALDRLAGDRDRSRAMGARAREVALAKYSAERMLDDYLRVYAELTASRSRRPSSRRRGRSSPS
jgi:glycosyltransferase involved in cell wall biosynthesis